MTSVLVFDRDLGLSALDFDWEDQVLLSSQVIQFDDVAIHDVLESSSAPTGVFQLDPVQTDVLIGDPSRVMSVVAGQDLPDHVVLDGAGVELVVVDPVGPRGPAGPASTVPGPPGPPGDVIDPDLIDLATLFENGLI